jgi:zinc transporter ZupT
MFLEKTKDYKYKKYRKLSNIFLATSLTGLVFLLILYLLFEWSFLDYIANFLKGVFILGVVFELIPEILEKNIKSIIWGLIFILIMIFILFVL